MNGMSEISAEELKKKLDHNETIVLLDVRQEDEHEFTNIGGTLIPLNDLAGKFIELDPKQETVVYCRSGARSAMAVRFLREQGFVNVKNLSGGLLAWAKAIDPSVKSY